MIPFFPMTFLVPVYFISSPSIDLPFSYYPWLYFVVLALPRSLERHTESILPQ